MNTGSNWTLDLMEVAIERDPHGSTLVPEVFKQMQKEIVEKVQNGKAGVLE